MHISENLGKCRQEDKSHDRSLDLVSCFGSLIKDGVTHLRKETNDGFKFHREKKGKIDFNEPAKILLSLTEYRQVRTLT